MHELLSDILTRLYEDVDLSEINLEGVEFRNFGFYSLPKVNFSKANLKDVDLGEQFLEKVNFSGANARKRLFLPIGSS